MNKIKKIVSSRIVSSRSNDYNSFQNLIEDPEQLRKKIASLRFYLFKAFNHRNIDFVGTTCKLLAPFVITAGITVGVFKVFGGGFPFHRDAKIEYKTYSLDYSSIGYVSTDEEYKTNMDYQYSLPSNSLVIYTPWVYENGQYIRFKREYNLDNTVILNLFDAVLAEDYEYVSENLKVYRESKQIANRIDVNEYNGYFFEASLNTQDKADFLKYSETELKNIIITIVEMIITLSVGIAFNYYRKRYAEESSKFDYMWDLHQINFHYKSQYEHTIDKINIMKRDLERKK